MFDKDMFIEVLALRIAEELRSRASEFRLHRLGAVAMYAAPWHKSISLSVLIETDRSRKWDIADWEHNEFADLGDLPGLPEACEALQAPKGDGSLYAPFFPICASAMCHTEVIDALKLYTLESDFELFVDDPDDPNQVNHCEAIVGVDKSRRIPKTEIINNLDEGLKDPTRVLSLKYWYQDTLTQDASDSIRQFENLEVLHMESLNLNALPACVLSLKRLRELWLDHNSIVSLTGLDELKELRLLSLRDNGPISPSMAKDISEFGGLQQLYVGNCGLNEVPESWRRLLNLEELYLFGNPLSSLPEWVPALPKLKRLGLVDVADELTKARIKSQYPDLEVW